MTPEEMDEKCITIMWTVENMTYCSTKFNRYLASPSFEMDGMICELWITPRGAVGSEDNLCFYFSASKDGNDVVNKIMRYELAIIGKDDSVLVSYTSENIFPQDKGCGFDSLVKMSEVYKSKREIFLPEDTLTMRCRLWKRFGEMTKNVKCLARTIIGVEKISFLWDLENFSTLEPEKRRTYLIKSAVNNRPILSVDFFLTEDVYHKEIIRVEMQLQDENVEYSTLRLFLVDVSRNRVQCNEKEIWFKQPIKRKYFSFFFTREVLLANKKTFLPNDVLQLYWEWVFSDGIVLEEIKVQYNRNNSEIEICDALKEKNNRSTRLFSVLSSSVFKEKFSTNMGEKDSDCVELEDIDDDIVKRMIEFLYTNHVEDLTWENVFDLYKVANDYDILNLKNLCASYMKNHLSLNSACDVLLLAHNCADNDMKSVVSDFVVKYGKRMAFSEWDFLIDSNGKVAAEILYRMVFEN
ncbi:TD and POZ domain-containing protein 4 [Argiope bruennichi]|uniref:TD and POZ domain-containing protein 4 n=1 Tax=Argiope bruennichi TaxID=94029 RepID=A0A8T0EF74_ARGBR|nr:TD and POZ domain-containing protein 4 [Argiope bruennichi]